MNNDLSNVTMNLVETLEEAQEFLNWLQQRRPLIAIDTESTGLSWWETRFVRLIQFGDELGGWALSADGWGAVIEQACKYVANAGIPVAMQNAKFDMHAMECMGWTTPAWASIIDTKILDHLCYPIRSHGLKQMGKRRFGEAAVVGDRMLKHFMNQHNLTWDTIPVDTEVYWAYGVMDTVLTARFAMELGAEVRERGMLPAFERESAIQAIAFRMEKRGLNIDLPYTQRLKDEWRDEMCSLKIQLDEWGVANPNSKAEVLKALKVREGWDPEAFTMTGEPKLDKNVLEGMDSRIAPLVIRYKRLVKWTGSYLNHFLDESVDGVVFPSINTMAARTGRMSVSNPGLQTLPSKEGSIRKCIVPDEGKVLHAVDYEAMELRVMASMSNDPGLLQVFREGLDPHSYVASVVYGLPYEELVAGQHKAQRGTAKNTQFARIYGAGAETIASTAGVPVHQIEEFMNIYDLRFPGVSKFMKEVERDGNTRLQLEGQPYVTTQYGRWLNVEPDSIFKLVNYAIQGACADLFKDRQVLLDKMGYGDNLVMWIHDEALLQFDEGDEDSPREVASIMEDHEMFNVPMTTSREGPFKSWGEPYGA